MIFTKINNFFPSKRCLRKALSYDQGQYFSKNIREYFYYIDHQGMRFHLCFGPPWTGFQLFLDDSKMKNFTSCFKDKDFLVFFFKRIRPNTTERYPEFPYVSLCGRERNYIRCDDTPLVYTHVIKGKNDDCDSFCYGHAGDRMFNTFFPDKLYMDPETGRVYHPCQEKLGGVGLVQSKLAIEFSKWFKFGNGEAAPPTQFQWKGRLYELDNEWYFLQRKLSKIDL